MPADDATPEPLNASAPHDPQHAQFVDSDGKCLFCYREWCEEKRQRMLNSVAEVCGEFPNVADYIRQLESQLTAQAEALRIADDLANKEKQLHFPNKHSPVPECDTCRLAAAYLATRTPPSTPPQPKETKE